VIAYLNPIFHDVVVDCGFSPRRHHEREPQAFAWTIYGLA
jgi:hypothetical protein